MWWDNCTHMVCGSRNLHALMVIFIGFFSLHFKRFFMCFFGIHVGLLMKVIKLDRLMAFKALCVTKLDYKCRLRHGFVIDRKSSFPCFIGFSDVTSPDLYSQKFPYLIQISLESLQSSSIFIKPHSSCK